MDFLDTFPELSGQCGGSIHGAEEEMQPPALPAWSGSKLTSLPSLHPLPYLSPGLDFCQHPPTPPAKLTLALNSDFLTPGLQPQPRWAAWVLSVMAKAALQCLQRQLCRVQLLGLSRSAGSLPLHSLFVLFFRLQVLLELLCALSHWGMDPTHTSRHQGTHSSFSVQLNPKSSYKMS